MKTKKKASVRSLFGDMVQLLYPKHCVVCSVENPNSNVDVCPICLSELNYTFFEEYKEPTVLDQLFWGRVNLTATYALFRFRKEGAIQKILHELKYHNNPSIGRYFGEELGNRLKQMNLFQDVDLIVPVPLHHRKQFFRGYNQAEAIGLGINSATTIPINNTLLKRIVSASSQTKKGRISRWENIQNRFQSVFNSEMTVNHILLVDDVITTGSTLEICCQTLKKVYPNAKISVAALAVAE